MALAVAAEALAGTIALKGARAGVLVLLVKIAAAALADTVAVPVRMKAISIGYLLGISHFNPSTLQALQQSG